MLWSEAFRWDWNPNCCVNVLTFHTFTHFATFGLVFFELKSLSGIAGQWSLQKLTILTLKLPSHVRILIYRTIIPSRSFNVLSSYLNLFHLIWEQLPLTGVWWILWHSSFKGMFKCILACKLPSYTWGVIIKTYFTLLNLQCDVGFFYDAPCKSSFFKCFFCLLYWHTILEPA